MALSTTGIRFDGLSSGIDYQSIIDKLLALQKKPITALQTRVTEATGKKTAYQDLSARLLLLQGSAGLLGKGFTFNRTAVSSSNEGSLFGSGQFVGATGAYSFSVRQLAQSHQVSSQGFTDSGTTPVGAGTLTVEFGDGAVDRVTRLEFLRGQAGIDRGKFRITDQSGGTAAIDLSGALDLNDILNSINDATGISVQAVADGDRIVLRDLSGGTGTLNVQNLGGDTTATDLGIVGSVTAAAGNTLTGQALNFLSSTTRLSMLNDGNGVRQKGTEFSDSADFSITMRDGSVRNVNLPWNVSTVQGVVDAINGAVGPDGNASLNGDRTGLVIRDFTVGAGATTLASLNGSNALTDLGLVGVTPENSATGLADAVNGDTVVGRRVIASLNTILRRTLNGGENEYTSSGDPATDVGGVRDGTVTLRDRSGASTAVDLSRRFGTTLTAGAGGAQNQLDVATVSGFAVGGRVRVTDGATTEYHTIAAIDGGANRLTLAENLGGGFGAGASVYGERDTLGTVLKTLNQGASAGGVQLSFAVGAQANALVVNDSSGGSATNLTVSDAAGTAASDLGIAQDVADVAIRGTDLDPRYINENMKLTALNNGRGVYAGRFRVTDTNGLGFNVDITQSGDDSIERVIMEINGGAGTVGSGIQARVNDTGDGILIQDTTPGTGLITVSELDGATTARDLGLLGSSSSGTPTRLDGSFEKTLTIGASDTLSTVSSNLNGAGFGITASLINDGNPFTPYRLTILSRTSGTAGRLILGGSSPLAFQSTADAQDAVLVYGNGAGSGSPVLVRSSKNTIDSVVPGLTLDLRGVSANPVTITVTRDTKAVSDQADRLVTGYNDLLGKMKDYTKFDPTTNEKGVLFGESGVTNIRRELGRLMTSPIEGLATQGINTLAEVGFKFESNGQLTLDKSKLESSLSTNFDDVVALFTRERPLIGATLLKDMRDGRGIGLTDNGPDLRVTRRDGVAFDVDFTGMQTLDQVLIAINNHAGNTGGLIQASIGADGRRIELRDQTGGAGSITVTSLNGSTTANDLGVATSVSDTLLKGTSISLTNDPGAATRLSDRVKTFTGEPTSLIETRTQGIDRIIDGFKKKITSINTSVSKHEERLVREFARLESYLASSQQLQTSLASQLSSIVSGFQSSKK